MINGTLSWLKERPDFGQRFVWIHIWDPHAPFRPSEPCASLFREDPYTGEVAYTDEQLGSLFNFRGREKLEEKTLINITGDHGESLDEHDELIPSYFACNSIILVPLIFAGPGIDVLKEALALCDSDPKNYNHLGIAYWQEGEFANSVRAYEKALSLDPHDAPIVNNYATLYLAIATKGGEEKELLKAEELFKQAMAMDPELAATYNGLGSVFKLKGQLRTENLYGLVVDIEGNLLPGASVTLSWPVVAPMTNVTSAEGRFRFVSLPPGSEYEVKIELQGFKT